MRIQANRLAFTIVELMVVITIIAVLMGILLPALSGARNSAKLLEEQKQAKSIVEGWASYASEHDFQKPVPGLVQRQPVTVGDGNVTRYIEGRGAEDGGLNTHGNMMSLCIMDRRFDPETTFSSVDTNPNVYPLKSYNHAAYDPYPTSGGAGVFWDPQYTNDLENDCNNSYAITPLCGERRQIAWDKQAGSGFALMGTRGVENGEESKIKDSNTANFFGRSGQWRGILVFADGHAEVTANFWPVAAQYAEIDNEGVTTYSPDNVYSAQTDAVGSWNADAALLGRDAFLTHVNEVDWPSESGLNPRDLNFVPQFD